MCFRSDSFCTAVKIKNKTQNAKHTFTLYFLFLITLMQMASQDCFNCAQLPQRKADGVKLCQVSAFQRDEVKAARKTQENTPVH